MPITKATQNVITPNIVTTDTTQTITGIKTISANSASTALTITQTGTGEAFRVEDSASPDATPFTISNTGVVQFNAGRGIANVINSKVTSRQQTLNGYAITLIEFIPTTNSDSTTFSLPISGGILDVYVDVLVTKQNNTTSDFNNYFGGYKPATDGLNFLAEIVSGVTTYKINGATTAQNINTVRFTGSAQTEGGIPASGYVTIQGGTNWTVTMRGHTTADTTGIWYGSIVTLMLISHSS